MKLLSHILLLFGLLYAAPAFAETIVVAEGDAEMTGTSNTTYSGAYDVLHSDFYINSGSAWGIAELESNIASTTSHAPAWVTIAVRSDLATAASSSAWFSALTTHIANLRAATPGVKIAVMTLPPNSDATYTARRPVVNGLIRAAEGVEIDRVIDFAAHPQMGPDSAVSDGNLFSANNPVTCLTACSLTLNSSASVCYNTVTTGGAKGQDYYNKQYQCAMEAILANKYPWTVYEQPVAYSVSPVVPTSDPPAYLLAQPDDVPTVETTTGWTTTDAATYCGGAGCFPLWVSGAFMEKKFRMTMNGTWAGRYDPIRCPFQTICGHAHTGFGVNSVTGSSTYKTLRQNQTAGQSWSAGGLLNSTAYWVPGILQPNAIGDSVTRMKRIKYVIVYYNASWAGDTTPVGWDLPRGMSYVGGTNMDDPLDVKVKAEIALYSSRVSYIGNGFAGWNCEGGVTGKAGLTNTDGTDALGACPASSDIYAEISGPECWDGVNLRASDAYFQMRKAVRNSNTAKPTCADNWYPIPTLQVKVFYSHLSTTDYLTWYCDSDMAFQTLGGSVRHCASYHTDWFGAWDYPTMQTWMHNCTGTKATSTDTPVAHQCDSSAIDSTHRLLDSGAAPVGGRNPQVNLGLDVNGSQASEWWDVPASSAVTTSGHRRRMKLHKKQ